MRHPLGAHNSPNPVRPTYVAATTQGQGHRRVSDFRSGCTKPGQTPRMSTHCPPIHGLPRPRSDPQDVDDVSMGRADRGTSIAPTGLWCPGGSRPTVWAPPPLLPSRSRRDTSPAAAPRGQRLRSEGTNNAQRRTRSDKTVGAGRTSLLVLFDTLVPFTSSAWQGALSTADRDVGKRGGLHFYTSFYSLGKDPPAPESHLHLCGLPAVRAPAEHGVEGPPGAGV